MSKFNFEKKLKDLEKTKKIVAKGLGSLSVAFFKESFRGSQAGFIDEGLKKWKEVKRREKGAKAKTSSRTRAILVKTGQLKNSIKVQSATFEKITIGSYKKYAAVHNFGLKAGRGLGFTMPKRQFVGNSAQLTKKHLTFIKENINKAFK